MGEDMWEEWEEEEEESGEDSSEEDEEDNEHDSCSGSSDDDFLELPINDMSITRRKWNNKKELEVNN